MRLFWYKTSMQNKLKKSTAYIIASLIIVFCKCGLIPVSNALAEQPIFRGDTSSGISQQTFIIDENNQFDDLKLQFGNALDEYIQWDNDASQFQISNNLDLLGNEISDFRVENLPSAPTCDLTKTGRIYYNTTGNHGYICDGSAWNQIKVTSVWTLLSDILFPNATTTDFAIGGTTLADSIFSIDESTGTFLFNGDRSANPTLNFEAMDSDAGSLSFNSNDTFAFSGAGVAIGTAAAVSPLHVYENDALTDATSGLTVEQNGAGDAIAQFLLTGVQRWVVGIDNSDGDKFKIGTTPLGTADKISIGSTSIQIGSGEAGTTTPLLFGLDVKSSAGDPAGGFEGAMYYNTLDNKFRCYEGAIWVDCANDNISVNGAAATDADFDNTTPPAPNYGVNVTWQKDSGTPNNISAYISGVRIPIDRDTTRTTVVSNSNTEATLYSYTVPANLLGTDRILKMTVLGAYINNTGSNQTLRVRYKFGGAEMWNDVTANAASNANERGFRFEFWIANQGTTNSQTGGGTAFIGGTGAASAGSGDLGSYVTLGDAHITFTSDPSINTTSPTTMEITVQMSTTKAGTSVRQDLAFMELY
jgi:hypothetical protein